MCHTGIRICSLAKQKLSYQRRFWKLEVDFLRSVQHHPLPPFYWIPEFWRTLGKDSVLSTDSQLCLKLKKFSVFCLWALETLLQVQRFYLVTSGCFLGNHGWFCREFRIAQVTSKVQLSPAYAAGHRFKHHWWKGWAGGQLSGLTLQWDPVSLNSITHFTSLTSFQAVVLRASSWLIQETKERLWMSLCTFIISTKVQTKHLDVFKGLKIGKPAEDNQCPRESVCGEQRRVTTIFFYFLACVDSINMHFHFF